MSCQGPVKSFNLTKGFGFIVYNGQDVFCHIKDCGEAVPQVGDTLSFDVEESASKPGQMKASNVTGGTGKLDNGNKGLGKGKGIPGTGACYGTVKSFNGGKGYGFISHEGTDVFFHQRDMVDGSTPQAGDSLQFDLEENPQKAGSMKAKNATGGTGWPEDKGKGKGKDKGYGAAPAWGGGWGGGKGWDASPYGGGADWGKGGGWGGGKGYDDW